MVTLIVIDIQSAQTFGEKSSYSMKCVLSFQRGSEPNTPRMMLCRTCCEEVTFTEYLQSIGESPEETESGPVHNQVKSGNS